MSDRTLRGEFLAETNEETGELGIRPAWMPNADPYWAMAVAHDLLEHFPDDDGGVEAEFMALGAAYWLRHESGYTAQKYPQSPHGPAEAIGSDFIELYRHIAHEGFSLLDPGTVEPIEDEDTDEMLRRIARVGQQYARDEESYNGDEEEAEELALFCSDQSRERIVGWLRKGYRRATERFEGCDAYSLAESVFGEIETRVDAWLKGSAEVGMFLEVEVDLDSYAVTIEAGYGDLTEREECHECGGSRELDGEEQGNYHDCPGAALGTCDGHEPNEDCEHCDGAGYVCPPVKCDTCDEDGLVPAYYRESL